MRRSFKAVTVFAVLCLTPTSYARYYDPEYGRFLSRDEMEGKLDSAPSLHRFVYANANPLRYTDPNGHNSMEGWSGFSPAPLPPVSPMMTSPGPPRPDTVSAGPQLDFMAGIPQARLLTDAIQVPLAAAVAGPAVGPYVLVTAEGLNLGTAISQRDPVNIGIALLPTAFRIGGMRSTILEYQAAKAGIARQNIGLSAAGFGAEIETSPGVFVSKPARVAAGASVGEVIDGEFSVVGEQSRPLLGGGQISPALPPGTLPNQVFSAYQNIVDALAPSVIARWNSGAIRPRAGSGPDFIEGPGFTMTTGGTPPLPAKVYIGSIFDAASRGELRRYLTHEGIPEGPTANVRVNRRLDLPRPRQEGQPEYRIPDLLIRSAGEARDLSIGWKDSSTPQFRDITEGLRLVSPQTPNVQLVTPSSGPLKATR